MAANLDKSENSLTSVSTLTYLRGIDASGNSVKISTSDLASVLGEGVNFNVSFSGDLNDYSRPLPPTVLFSPSNLSAQNLPPISRSHSFFFSVSVSYVHANHSSDNTRVLQTAVDIEDGSTWFRIKRGSGWSDWTEFSINIPSFYKDYNTVQALANAMQLFLTNEGNARSTIRGSYSESFTDKPATRGFHIRLDDGSASGNGYELFFSHGTSDLWFRNENGGGWRKLALATT